MWLSVQDQSINSSVVTLKKPRARFPKWKFAIEWTWSPAFKGTKMVLAWMDESVKDWCVWFGTFVWKHTHMRSNTAAGLAAHAPLVFLTRRQMQKADGWGHGRRVLCCLAELPRPAYIKLFGPESARTPLGSPPGLEPTCPHGHIQSISKRETSHLWFLPGQLVLACASGLKESHKTMSSCIVSVNMLHTVRTVP